MVEYAAQIMGSVADSVTLIGEPDRYRKLGIPCVADLRPGLGPLAGLETALSATQTCWNIILPCDMPGIDSSTLSSLCRMADQSSSKAVLLRDSDGLVHPLCGLYRRHCLPEIRSALDTGQLRLMDVVARLQAVYVDIAFSVLNINTPEQWSAALRSYESFHGN